MFSLDFNANVKTGSRLERRKMMQSLPFYVFAYFLDASFRHWMQHIVREWCNLFMNFAFPISGEFYDNSKIFHEIFLVRSCVTIVCLRIFRTS